MLLGFGGGRQREGQDEGPCGDRPALLHNCSGRTGGCLGPTCADLETRMHMPAHVYTCVHTHVCMCTRKLGKMGEIDAERYILVSLFPVSPQLFQTNIFF